MQINKKGFLLGEYTLKVIIAVLVLLLLFYLLFVLYGSFQDNQEREQAKSTLEEIAIKMELAKNSPQKIVLLNPKRELSYWNKGEKRPVNCENNCLCFCFDSIYSHEDMFGNSKISDCDDAICKNFNEKVIIEQGSLRPVVEISIKYNEGYIISEVENE